MRVPRLTLLAALGNKRAKPSRHLQLQARKHHNIVCARISSKQWEMGDAMMV